MGPFPVEVAGGDFKLSTLKPPPLPKLLQQCMPCGASGLPKGFQPVPSSERAVTNGSIGEFLVA
jgi:hypothetical protein